MKEVEITLRVKDSLEECKNKLEKQNYKMIRKSLIDDVYMTQNLADLNKNNIDFFSCPQSRPTSGSFPMSQLFA